MRSPDELRYRLGGMHDSAALTGFGITLLCCTPVIASQYLSGSCQQWREPT